MGKLPKLYYMFNTQGKVHNIYLYDDIEEKGDWNWETWTRDDSETSAKHFQEELAQIPETDEICLYINSNGGSVKEVETAWSTQDRLCGRCSTQHRICDPTGL